MKGKFEVRRQHVGWAKEHTPEEAQRLIDRFQTKLAAAVLEMGNAGLDPATCGDIMCNMGEGVGFTGYGPIEKGLRTGSTGPQVEGDTPERTAQFVQNTSDIVVPTLDAEIAKMGGNSHEFVKLRRRDTKAKMDRLLGELDRVIAGGDSKVNPLDDLAFQLATPRGPNDIN